MSLWEGLLECLGQALFVLDKHLSMWVIQGVRNGVCAKTSIH